MPQSNSYLVYFKELLFAHASVKYVTQNAKHGLPGILLTCTEGHGRRRRYECGEFDFIVGYYLFNDTAYVYSFDEVTKYKTLVTISEEHAESVE